MEQRAIKALLEQVAAGQVDVDDALLRLKMEPFEELGFAKLDSHRGLRQGVAEVIYGAGKTPEQIAPHCGRHALRRAGHHPHYPDVGRGGGGH